MHYSCVGSFDTIDETKQETATLGLVLRVLPLMLGWFAMNAPSGLGLYWVFNNILTTTQTVIIKKVIITESILSHFHSSHCGFELIVVFRHGLMVGGRERRDAG